MEGQKTIKRRSESFFGLHYDFHANPKDIPQGVSLNEDDIREVCRKIKPDFIQIDCKGHPGWASYPSLLGNAVPEFEKDTLALWRKVTKEEGVALYMHYSGVFDRKYCAENPKEAIYQADGTYSDCTTRLDGKYVDELLIPQMLELVEKYHVDGIWIDGDCWMASPDFCPESLAKFERETGIDLNGEIPSSPEHKYYQEYRDFSRELFRRYLNHYVDTVHAKHPNFQIASNWAFSDHMPERVCANVDFLSGDLNPSDSFNSARYAARALAQQEYAWDLMSWNFRNSVGGKKAYASKHPNQIMQEAASVIAIGGAYQDYIPQYRDGSPNMIETLNLEKVSDFVLERKDFCFRGKLYHQAALLLSTYDRSREAKNLYARTGFERVMGACALLCDIGQSLEIVCEHTLEKYINEYKMIVIPELYCGLDDKTVKMLADYAKNGGKLVLIGKNTCKIFAESTDLPFSVGELDEFVKANEKENQNGHNSEYSREYLPYIFATEPSEFGALFSPCQIIAENGDVEAFAKVRNTKEQYTVSKTVLYGKGSVTPIGFDIGSQYLKGTQYMQRKLMKNIATKLYDPIVRIESVLGRLEIVALNKDEKLMVQLVNANGSHSNNDTATDDLVPPILDIKLSILLDKKPKKLILQPQGKELSFEYENSRAYVDIDRVHIHSVIEVVKE